MTTRRSAQRTRSIAVLVASILLIIGLIAWIAVARQGGSNADFTGAGNGEEEIVEIAEGSTISQLGPELEQRGIVKTNGAFQTAAANNPDSDNIHPGFYRLQGEMSAKSAVEALVDPANRITPLKVYGGATLMDINVLGGQRRLGIFSMIQDVTCGGNTADCVDVEKLNRVASEADAASLGVPAWAQEVVNARRGDAKRLEGLIAPGEYIIDPGATADDILTDLITRSAKQYDDTGIVERAKGVGLSPYELLVAASLVEREAPAGEFDKVARVILNRLAAPMRLEFDSTVNYGLPSVEVATTDADRQRVTPWNTYAMDGLPQTPIASPSIEAIEAMENPAQGNWLFFVTVDKDGTTVFNDTFEQHLNDTQRAVDSGVLDSNR